VDKEIAPLPPAGSDIYYALLYGPRAPCKQLAAINALKAEICAVPVSVSDVGVARIKLEWWRLEAARFVTGEAVHRLTQTYAHYYGADDRIGNALHALIGGLDGELGGRSLPTSEQQWAWFDTTFGPLYAVQATVLANTEVITTSQWQNLGRWIEIGYSLLNLKPLAARNLIRLPEVNLDAAGCTWDDIQSGRKRVAVAELVDRECAIAIDHIADIIAHTPNKTRRKLLPLFTLACIVQHALVELREDGCRIWQHRIELTPLRKLWLAWRMRFF